MLVNLKTEVSGWFKIEAIKPDGSKRILADWFPNLITDQGLDRMGTSNTWISYCHVGTGSTAPATSDTQLVSFLASSNSRTTTTRGIQSSSPYYTYRTHTYRFNEGVAAGNLSEVGVGWTAANGALYSRALILDGAGNPTTLTILSNETLDVTYQCRHYIPETDVTGTVVLRGTTHTWTARAANCTGGNYWWNQGTAYDVGIAANASIYGNSAYTGAIGAITTIPSGTNLSGGTLAFSAYSASSLLIDATITYSLAQGNNALGIGAILVSMGLGYYQIGFTPTNIMKTADDVLVLNLRHSWARKTI
jgi:hypothetical protein